MTTDEGSDNREELQELLQRAYAVQSPDDNRELYAAWADTYESGFTVPNRYLYHYRAAEIYCEAADAPAGPVLDAGCGTGLVGERLRAVGVTIVDGLDISAEMLAEASKKTAPDGSPAYRNLIEADLTATLDIPDNTYPAIITTGMFTHGHVGQESMAELLRVAQPGARCVIGINAAHYEKRGYRKLLDRFAADGKIRDLEVRLVEVYHEVDKDNLNQHGQVAIFTPT